MPDHRTRFLQLALHAQALRFGEFTLKSGRLSPYFFNAGRFDSGARLAELAACYADAVEASGVQFDLLFGPAYKGIPLATALACEFSRRGRDLPVAFNRKEAKAHGEGGMLIGAPLEDRKVLIVDDVITAGTAIREALGLIHGGGQGDAFVGWAEQQVELHAGGFHGIGIAGRQFRQLGAAVETAGIEEIGTEPPGLQGELAEAQGLGVQGELQEAGAVVRHG